jgi:hypothetical protein
MKLINGAYIDGIDELSTEILYHGSQSISVRINRNYKFSIDNTVSNIYVIRIHVAYVQNELYDSISFFNSLFLKIENLGYSNKKDHIVFTMQEEGSINFNKILYNIVKEVRPYYDLTNICYADEKLNIKPTEDTLKHLNFIHQCNSAPVQSIEHNIEKDKLFLTLNRRHKIHRTMLVGRIIEENLLDKSLVSFFPVCEGSNFKDSLMISTYLSDERKSNYLKWLDREFILDNDYDTINSNRQVTNSKALTQLHKRSYISVICETRFDENEISVTEKTYKSIAHKHPFIIIGVPRFLSYLQDLGYRTFHPIIDESYDNIHDPELRFEAIISEMKRLSNLSLSELRTFQKEISAITEYNHKIHNNNFEYLDQKTTLFPYIDKFDKNVENIIKQSQVTGGILKLRVK